MATDLESTQVYRGGGRCDSELKLLAGTHMLNDVWAGRQTLNIQHNQLDSMMYVAITYQGGPIAGI